MKTSVILKTSVISLFAALLAVPATAQTVTFNDDYLSVGVYDAWEGSPFRTGELKGNAKVITVSDSALAQAEPKYATFRCLAFQRSRFGSNTFGGRIDLKETFELTTVAKYVHVLVNTPVEGRMMLIGLGRRTERKAQSKEAEQFWVYPTSTIVPGQWCDAVFPVTGAGGIDIYSLVLVPHCESPHALTQDFAAFVGPITINDSPSALLSYEDYPLNIETTAVSAKTNYYLNSISLNGSADGDQTFEVGSHSPQYVWRDLTSQCFRAKAGEKLTPAFSFSGSWMNGYVYLDRGHDGRFDADLNADYTIPASSDLMTYSYVETVENVEGYNSKGQKVTGNSRNVLDPPAFTLPADLEPGIYRMRYKVDWGSVEPGGRVTTTNSITSNGGSIVDVLINVHADSCRVAEANRNGTVTAADGSALGGCRVPFGQPLAICAVPERGFTCEGVRVRHGYNLAGDATIHSVPQYAEDVFPAYLFQSDGTFTLPGDCIDGDVEIEGLFVEQKGTETTDSVDYARAFPDTLQQVSGTGALQRFSFTATHGGSSVFNLTPAQRGKVYIDFTSKQASVVPGDELTPKITATGVNLNAYLYVDLNQDGQFAVALDADGTPSMASELVSYSYYQGLNSAGEQVDASAGVTLPPFALSSFLPTGVYRARLKIDTDDIDPAGHWSEGAASNLDNTGGCIVDFLLNVHATRHPLTIITTHGSVYGANNTALPDEVTPFQSLTIVPTAVASGYAATELLVRHGHHLDGPQYVHGNRQWGEYRLKRTTAHAMPADSVNGDLRVTCLFEPTADADWQPVFVDEFDGADGTQPSADYWSRSTRYSAAWNRWISDSEEVIYVEDGHLVARAIPNPDRTKDNVAMLTGAVQTRGRFSFCYGKVECRARTNPFTGNFPAIWMMPEDQSAHWPSCGEIDIWETIDTDTRSYHTVHSNWTYTLGNTSSPKSSYNRTTDCSIYHTYGLLWTDKKIQWLVDGKSVGSYSRSADDSVLDQGQWPFDKPFYLILNQSVGNGSWASQAETTHVYETDFDWIRVYQSRDVLSVESLEPGLSPSTTAVYDLMGREVQTPTHGIYIQNGKKVLYR